MLGSEGSTSKLNSLIGSNFTIDKFSHEASNLPIDLKSPEDLQFYHKFSRGDDVEAVICMEHTNKQLKRALNSLFQYSYNSL